MAAPLPLWAVRLRAHRERCGWSVARAAEQLRVLDPTQPADLQTLADYLRKRWETGKVVPSEHNRAQLCRLYDDAEIFAEITEAAPVVAHGSGQNDDSARASVIGDELDVELLELARRAEASDVGATALDAVDLTVAHLAVRYSRTPPAELLAAIRSSSRHVVSLLDGRATLAQRQRLLVAGGWLSLLAATVHVDLGHPAAARIARKLAMSLGRESGEAELGAWSVEIAAWEALVDRRWADALSLARAGQDLAPRSRAAIVQLTAQEARAAARLGDARTVHKALAAAEMRRREQPDGQDSLHHFVFDPAKLVYYTATALTWLSDPAAESYSREVVRTSRAPRRVATAQVDLGLVLATLGRPDEATSLGGQALSSGWLVSSNAWRVGELVATLATRYPHLAEARNLDERFRSMAPTQSGGHAHAHG
jgi:hypothetical protein